MRTKEAEIIKVKRLKKDGSIDMKIVNNVAASLRNRNIIVLPIDNIYGLLGVSEDQVKRRISDLHPDSNEHSVRLISSFRMLNNLAHFSKFEYDFLNRIWPGEVNVILRGREEKIPDKNIIIGFPKSKFLQNIIEAVDMPLISSIPQGKGAVLYREKEIIKHYKDSSDLILIVEELCKKSPLSTLIDISKGELRIVYDGKLACEEIKSLYFLGKDDEAVY